MHLLRGGLVLEVKGPHGYLNVSGDLAVHACRQPAGRVSSHFSMRWGDVQGGRVRAPRRQKRKAAPVLPAPPP